MDWMNALAQNSADQGRDIYTSAKSATNGFFGGEEPSVMDPRQGDIYRKSELASLFSNLIPGKAPLVAGAGILKKFTNVPSYLGRAISEGKTARQLFDDYNAVKVGDHYFQFLKDDLKAPPTNGTYLVKDLTNGLSKDVGNIPVTYEPMRKTLWGSAQRFPDNSRALKINSGLSNISKRGTLGHEIQHPYDEMYNGLGGGTTMAKANNSSMEYNHNLGEVRARLNELLNSDPDHFQGLQSVFKRGEFDPKMLWE